MDMENRKVVVYEYQDKGPHSEPFKVEIGKGVLLAFGVDYEELTCAVGTFSTAIVEMEDGSVKNVPVENIKFEEITSPHEGNFENLRKCGEKILNDLKREESLSSIDDYFKREGAKHTQQNLKDIADMFEAAYKKDNTQRERNYRMSVAAERMASSFKAAYSEDMTPEDQRPCEINWGRLKYLYDKDCAEQGK